MSLLGPTRVGMVLAAQLSVGGYPSAVARADRCPRRVPARRGAGRRRVTLTGLDGTPSVDRWAEAGGVPDGDGAGPMAATAAAAIARP